MPCQFSEMVLGSSAIFSPDHRYISVVSGSRLTVRETDTVEILHVFSCVDKIEKVVFSPDSQYILCGMFSRNAIQIFSIADGEWRCRINEGVAGIIQASWGPDSRCIITESDFGLQLGVWNLTDSSSLTIPSPKANLKTSPSILLDSSPCLANKTSRLSGFSDCGRYFAIVQRINAQDQLGIYTTNPWGIANKFKCKSADIASICWSPCSNYIITADSALTYNLITYDLHGQVISKYEAYKHALGIRSCVFHRIPNNNAQTTEYINFQGKQKVPTHYHTMACANHTLSILQRNAEDKLKKALPAASFERSLSTDPCVPTSLIAVGSFDGRIRLFSTTSWKCAHVLPLVHPSLMEPGLASSTVCTVELTEAQSNANNNNVTATNNNNDGTDNEMQQDLVALQERTLIFNMTATKGAKAAKMSMKTRGACYVKRDIKELPQRSERKEFLHTTKIPPTRGVLWNGWSADGLLLAARDAAQPQCLWIWDAFQAQLLALLVQLDSVTCARWRPLVAYKYETTVYDKMNVLAYCCGTSRIYFWSADAGPTWCDLPHNPETGVAIVVNSIQWSSDGNKLLCQGTEALCVANVYIDKTGACTGIIEKSRKVNSAMDKEAMEDIIEWN